MGLDVAYFRDAVAIEPPKNVTNIVEWANSVGAGRYYTLGGMKERLEGIESEWVTGQYRGIFRVGGYSWYGRWRNRLSLSVLGVAAQDVWRNPEKFAAQPFYELIDFADNEGCIGPTVSAKLSTDFAENRENALNGGDVTEADTLLYDNFAKAFEEAAKNGFVKFC